MNEQLALAVTGASCSTRCGYCNRPLQRLLWRPGWSCPRCAPILAALCRDASYCAFLDAFRAFQREARADRVRS